MELFGCTQKIADGHNLQKSLRLLYIHLSKKR